MREDIGSAFSPNENNRVDSFTLRGKVFLQSKIGKDIYNSIVSGLKDQCSKANPVTKAHFIKDEKFITKRILLSKLREAPIIGMGAKVWMEYC